MDEPERKQTAASDDPTSAPSDETPSPNQPTRRTVLKAIAIGGGAVALAGAGGVSVRAGTNGVWTSGKGDPYELWESWQDIAGTEGLIAAAVLAANPHNIQPWTFTLDGESIEIATDPTYAMPLGDSDSRERNVALGCAAQNVATAAAGRGQHATVSVQPSIVRIDLASPSTASDRDLAMANAISDRHTNRGPFTSDTLDDSLLYRIAEGGQSRASVHWVTDTSALAELGDLYVEATEAIIGDEPMSKEGFEWFRNSRSEIDTYRDGLTLDCQGLDPVTLFMAKILPAQTRTQGDEYWVKTTRDVHTATARAYGIIRVSDSSSFEDRVAGGMLLQYTHLAATAEGVGFHHMN